jgi:hypothetical protein
LKLVPLLVVAIIVLSLVSVFYFVKCEQVKERISDIEEQAWTEVLDARCTAHGLAWQNSVLKEQNQRLFSYIENTSIEEYYWPLYHSIHNNDNSTLHELVWGLLTETNIMAYYSLDDMPANPGD